jgi:hypothetical protein
MGENDIAEEEATRCARQGRLARVSLGICLIAIGAAFVLMLLATNDPWSLNVGDGAILLYVLGPYLALAGIAWASRRGQKIAWTVFLTTVVLVAWGLWTNASHTYYFLTDMEFRKVQPLAIFLVPLAQWFVVVCLAAAVGLWRWRVSRLSPRNGNSHP